MSFWSVAGPEPKRNFRWVVVFTGPNAGNPLQQISYALKKVNKPKGKFGDGTKHNYLNHEFYFPGRFVWDPIQMTIASVTKPDAVFLVNKLMQNAGYGVPNVDASQGRQTITPGKRKFAGALGNTLKIIQLDADGKQIETWSLYNPFFTTITFGDGLDYANEEISEIACTVKYDWAEVVTSDPNEKDAPIPASPGFP
jgi:hypothetical protein